jgi:hypothetical protein
MAGQLVEREQPKLPLFLDAVIGAGSKASLRTLAESILPANLKLVL